MMYFETEYRFGILHNGLVGGVVFANVQSFSEPVSGKFETVWPACGAGFRFKLNKFSNTNVCLTMVLVLADQKVFLLTLEKSFNPNDMKLKMAIVLFAVAGEACGQQQLTPVPFSSVVIHDTFWKPRMDSVIAVTIPVCMNQTEDENGAPPEFRESSPSPGRKTRRHLLR